MTPDYKARKRGEPTLSIEERLYSKIKINTYSGCWEWMGTTRNGYGRITVGSRTDGSRRTEAAHRLSYILKYGEIPEGMEVCHRCDNRKCINPDHLFLGTRQDNINDREKKGRNITFSGESNPMSKLTQKDVIRLRQRKARENISYEKLAKEYGVNKRTVIDAIKGKNWKCVKYYPEPPEGVS